MSKIDQIQQALLSLGGGEFQKLADAYLAEKGYDQINSIGSVAGANKVRTGTPDTLVALPNGNYVFAEHTTDQRDDPSSKLKSDLDKCFDEDKTGVPVEKIERIIFCFVSESGLDAEEENELAELCQENDVNLDLFGLDAISFDLYQNYPGLARDFLGVQIDSGQIVHPERFISLYNRNKLATPLDLGFHFRSEELSQVLGELEDQKLVILSGRAGVGKSRLALEACQQFSDSHPEFEVVCVFGRDRDLWEDLQTRFSKPGKFLIFVDDANRVSRFEYVVDLLLHQGEDQEIKVIATVRDYALSKVRKASRPLADVFEIGIDAFSDEEIKELVTDEYGIVNHRYLQRIADIARGNPRLAVMAAEVAKREENLSSIYDVSALYDQYFSSIREDLQGEGADLASADLLKVAAIVSFFGALDRSNQQMMAAIQGAFDIDQAVLWESAYRLHELEIVDMYEDEVVRVSDQVLSTYLFYLAVFEEGVVDFGALLRHFFPEFRSRFIDAMNPVLSAFDSEQILDAMRPHVEEVWTQLEEGGDEEELLQLVDVFWFTRKTDTLVWLRNRINRLDSKTTEVEDIAFEKSSAGKDSPYILSVLKQFSHTEDSEVRMAINLMLDYVEKRPSDVPLLLDTLTDDYGFRPDSQLRGFSVQQAVVDALWDRVEEGKPLFARVCLALVEDYLYTRFENKRMKSDRVLQLTRFELPDSPELTSLRQSIWERLFELYEDENLQDKVLALVHNYSTSHNKVTISEVVGRDAEHVLPFLESVLDPTDYQDCFVLQSYLDLLEKHDVSIPRDLREQFSNETYALSEILLHDWGDRRELELSYDEYKQFKKDRIDEHTAGYAFEDYVGFFEQCIQIRDTLEGGPQDFQIKSGVVDALRTVAERDLDLYALVLEHYLNLGDPLELNGHVLVEELLEERGFDRTFQFLSEPNYPTKKRWLFHVFEALPSESVNEEQLDHLYEIYRSAERADLPHGLDYLLKYHPLDSRVVANVVGLILDKVDEDPGYASALTMLFNPHTEVAKQLTNLFEDNLGLLKRAYFAVEDTGQHGDYKGEAFDHILDVDPAFAGEYVHWKYENADHGWLSRHDETRHYIFIWNRPDYQEIMDRIVDSIYQHERDGFVSIAPYLASFFHAEEDKRQIDSELRERQDAYLLRLIDERNDDIDFIAFLFTVIARFSAQRRRLFVEHFVQRNDSIDAFKRLPLEPNSWTAHGSWVPVLQRRLNFWESLLPIMNTVDLLSHKQYVEHQIQDLRVQIEREKKKDFMGD